MIKTELLKIDDKTILVKTYSTENKYTKQLETNLEYDIAIDVGEGELGIYKPKNYTYEETDELIKEDEVLTE